MNTNPYMMWIVHVQVKYIVQHLRSRVICLVRGKYVAPMCVINHSHGRVIWRQPTQRVESIHLRVMCVLNHSHSRVIWRHINTYIVASIHLPVMCVISHSHSRVIWRHINTHIVDSIRLPVMCVISRSHSRVMWRHINTHSGEHPFTCDVCNKSFTKQGNLKAHQDT